MMERSSTRIDGCIRSSDARRVRGVSERNMRRQYLARTAPTFRSRTFLRRGACCGLAA